MNAVAVFAPALALLAGAAAAQAMPEPLTDRPGDADRGRDIVLDQRTGLCLLCHDGPFAEVPFMGNIAPPLAGVGARLDEGELRQRVVDSREINPDTIMPPFHSLDGLVRVGERWKDATILTAQQVEDVVAFLETLTEGEVAR